MVVNRVIIMAEKYTQWADKSCGINPFVPGEIPLPKQFLLRVGRYVTASLIAVPRILIALGLILLYTMIQLVLHEVIVFFVSLGLLWMCYSGLFDTVFLIPCAVLVLISLLSVMIY